MGEGPQQRLLSACAATEAHITPEAPAQMPEVSLLPGARGLWEHGGNGGTESLCAFRGQ